VKVDCGTSLKIEFSGKHAPHILRIRYDKKPSSISLDGQHLPEGDAWRFEANSRRLTIKTRDYAQGTYLIK
jgi:hypothetical protein